jgi:malate:Na+ symporter
VAGVYALWKPKNAVVRSFDWHQIAHAHRIAFARAMGSEMQLALLAAILLMLALLGPTASKLKVFGLDTIAIVFVPSYVVFCGWVDPATTDTARAYFDRFDITGWFIVVLIVGSVITIEKRILAKGLARMAIPLIVGSIAAALCGLAVAQLLGVPVGNALFRIILPVMGGGVTAGALPLSIGFSGHDSQSQAAWLAAMLPAVFVGNFMAMLMAALLRTTGAQTTSAPKAMALSETHASASRDMLFIGLAVSSLIAFYLIGYGGLIAFGLPAPLTVILIAALLQLADIIPARLNSAIKVVYKFCIATFTYPILFAVGLFLTPWTSLVRGFLPINLAIIATTVGALTVTGYVVARLVDLPPEDSALITTARAAMGGSGDIAILNVARRMDLMPFAQIATRIGGAITVALALAWISAGGAHVL